MVYASYTIALLFLLIAILLSVFTISKKKWSTAIFILFVVIAIVLTQPIIAVIHDMAVEMDLRWIVNRTEQILNIDAVSDITNLKRFQLYEQSIQCFFSNPIIGGGDVGGHSMILDNLGSYGTLGIIFLCAVISWLNKIRKDAFNKEGMIYFLFMVLMLINNVDTITMLPMMFFVLPIMLSLKKTNGETYEEKPDGEEK